MLMQNILIRNLTKVEIRYFSSIDATTKLNENRHPKSKDDNERQKGIK